MGCFGDFGGLYRSEATGSVFGRWLAGSADGPWLIFPTRCGPRSRSSWPRHVPKHSAPPSVGSCRRTGPERRPARRFCRAQSRSLPTRPIACRQRTPPSGRHSTRSYACPRCPDSRRRAWSISAGGREQRRGRLPMRTRRSLGSPCWTRSRARCGSARRWPTRRPLRRSGTRPGRGAMLPVDVPAADLVTVSYVLGELTDAQQRDLVARAAAAAGLLMIVEPGTPAGYARVIAARDQLVGLGHTVVAPCPHQEPCPLASGDWCHFGVRVNRTALHRRIKGRRSLVRGREVRLSRHDDLSGHRWSANRARAGDPPADAAKGPGVTAIVRIERQHGRSRGDEAARRALPAGA